MVIFKRHDVEKGTQTRNRTVIVPFSFVTWLRLHGVDLITMSLMGALALGIYKAPPVTQRFFPIYNLNGGVAYPEFAYPLQREIIPTWADAFIAFFAPFFFISLFQLRRRSVDDWLTTTLGLLKSLVTASLFQTFIKWLIGGLRPNFLAICQPNVSPDQFSTGVGFEKLMYDSTICTGQKNDVNDSLQSMPSGHSTVAWAGLLYLSLYLNAQLKVMSAHNPAYWKTILFFAPTLAACLISGTMTVIEYHHWHDVIAGAVIGICTALVAFRQTFASIWDFRFNHILLPRSSSLFHRVKPCQLTANRELFYRYRPIPELLTHDLPFAREGGWDSAMYIGAPNDATALFGNMPCGGSPRKERNTGADHIGNNGIVGGESGHVDRGSEHMA